MNRVRVFLKSHGLHLLFGLSILSLASLLAWWSVFIERSILERKELRYEVMMSEMRLRAFELDKKAAAEIGPGVLADDPRFEIAPCPAKPGRFSVPIQSLEGFCLGPRRGVLDRIDSKTRSLKVMLTGEASLLALVVFASVFLLYQNIRIERRTLREVREFWERAAHEIKTPITGIKSFLQNLKGREDDLGEMSPYLDLALKQVDRQERLAENMLSGYRLDLAVSRLDMETLDIVRFLDKYLHRDALHLFGSRLILDLGPDPGLRIRGDSRALEVILDNVTMNALKYGNNPLVLSVALTREKDGVVISFEDNGLGFDEALAENIFEAFRHPDSELPGKEHGTGLGLYISRRLARAMGGDLRASSVGPGRGGRFLLWLKVAKNGK